MCSKHPARRNLQHQTPKQHAEGVTGKAGKSHDRINANTTTRQRAALVDAA